MWTPYACYKRHIMENFNTKVRQHNTSATSGSVRYFQTNWLSFICLSNLKHSIYSPKLFGFKPFANLCVARYQYQMCRITLQIKNICIERAEVPLCQNKELLHVQERKVLENWMMILQGIAGSKITKNSKWAKKMHFQNVYHIVCINSIDQVKD